MKFLFVHQNFPGQYLHIVRHLAASKRHDMVFISEPNANRIPGVRTVPYPKPRAAAMEAHVATRELDAAVRRAEVVAHTAGNLKQLGFTPDIIIGHHGWGELLNLRDVWPDVPLLGYFEFYYRINGIDVGFDPEFPTHPADFPRIRAKNAVNLLALNLGADGADADRVAAARPIPRGRRPLHHAAAGRRQPRRLPAESAGAAPQPDDRRDHDQAGRQAGHLCGARSGAVSRLPRDDARAAASAARAQGRPRGAGGRRRHQLRHARRRRGRGDRGCWRNSATASTRSGCCSLAVSITTPMLRMLQRSDAHVYLSYPFVASWSLREALAAGCVVIGGDTPTVSEFVTHEREWAAGAVLRHQGTGGHDPAGAGGHAAGAPAARRARGATRSSVWGWRSISPRTRR